MDLQAMHPALEETTAQAYVYRAANEAGRYDRAEERADRCLADDGAAQARQAGFATVRSYEIIEDNVMEFREARSPIRNREATSH